MGMLHLLPVDEAPESPQPYAEAVARLAGLRHALRLVDPFGGGPASDIGEDERVCAAWSVAPAAKRRCFDDRSERVITSTTAGLEALLADAPRTNPAAQQELAEEIRRGLEDISALMLDRPARTVELLPVAL